jgi:hypothetical protein
MPADVRDLLTKASMIYSPADVERALDQLSVKLTVLLQDQTPQFICVLPDSLVFTGMLMRRLVFPLTLSSASVPPQQAAGDVFDPARPIILLVGCLDASNCAAWQDWLRAHKGSTVYVAALLQSSAPAAQANFSALPAIKGRVIGCGFNHAGFGANWGGLFLLPENPPAQ